MEHPASNNFSWRLNPGKSSYVGEYVYHFSHEFESSMISESARTELHTQADEGYLMKSEMSSQLDD